MLNKVTLIGRLGKDPELKYTQAGIPVCSLNVATDESYTDRDGNKVNKTEWHRVQVWQRMAENCAQFLVKGSLVYVDGKLTTRKWQDQQGQDRYSTDVQALRVLFLDRKQEGDTGKRPPARQSQKNGHPSAHEHDDLGSAFPSEASGMDDVPF